MPVLQIMLVIILVGLALWLANTYIPMADPIKKILNIVVVVALVFWLLKVFGAWAYLSNIRV